LPIYNEAIAEELMLSSFQLLLSGEFLGC